MGFSVIGSETYNDLLQDSLTPLSICSSRKRGGVLKARRVDQDSGRRVDAVDAFVILGF